METVKGKPGGSKRAHGERPHIEDGRSTMTTGVAPDVRRPSDSEVRGATAASIPAWNASKGSRALRHNLPPCHAVTWMSSPCNNSEITYNRLDGPPDENTDFPVGVSLRSPRGIR